ncbi:MAG: hypothetical protein KAS71_05620, partial [Bacteroidales bacterium]|nr:hypothetical protein [Bacteroidales bacterium]
MNTRFIAEICWDADEALSKPGGANRFTEWWCREYFGNEAANDALATYNGYFQMIHSHNQIWQGAKSLDRAMLEAGYCLPFTHKIVVPNEKVSVELEEIRERERKYDVIFKSAEQATSKMNKEQTLFFFDNAMYGMLIDYRPTQAAALMWEFAQKRPNRKTSRALIYQAMEKLETLEKETLKAEYPPFENWYKPTWARLPGSLNNVHYSYDRMKEFMLKFNISGE